MENWDKQDAIKRIFNGFVKVFADSMNVIKPVKDDPYDTERTYEERISAWQMAFTFSKRLTIRVSGFASHIVLGGNLNSNLPDLQVYVGLEFINELNDVLNSGKFNEYMEIAKPNLPDDPRREEKIKAWEDSFNVTKKLQKFTENVKNAIDQSDAGYITLVGYKVHIYGLINALESN